MNVAFHPEAVEEYLAAIRPYSSINESSHPFVMIDAESISRKLVGYRSELQRFHVSELSVFGSVARGEKDVRDIDLMVEFSATPSLVEFIQLKEFLEGVLGMPVDLVSRRASKERFLREILPDLRHVA